VRTLPLRLLVAVTLAMVTMSLATMTGIHSATTVHAQAVLNTAASQDCLGGNFSCNYCTLNPATAACSPQSGTAAMIGAETIMNGTADIASADAQSNVGSARSYCASNAWNLIGSSTNMVNYLPPC
jgi:hypothetical protein